MSTFNGIVKEFPRIRIDYFRRNPDEKHAPLAYFLSHVHSDHLTGLETCKSPFIYCSPATRDILLGLEKYQHRMNFAKQILEAPTKTYRHLKKILRPIPLETPTTIELAPGNEVRVTLFDANHCVGAVMFLIEGDGRAVLYTGDIRSESWWVNGLTKHPILVTYVARDGNGQARKPLKTLDCIYADTTFASKEDPYKSFPSKSDGLIELLEKVSKYPKGTSFHFKAWTFGYEEVWEALASHLDARVHVDAYKWKLYRALANGVEPKAHDAAKYTGFKNGNGYQEGCLTPDTGTKLHSCEKGTECAIWNKDFVQITPIITRHNGIEMAEIGAGGGQGDLGQHELDINDMQTLGMLFSLVMSKVQDDAQQKAVIEMLNNFMKEGKSSIAFDDFDLEDDGGPEDGDGNNEDIDRPIEAIVPLLSKLAARSKGINGLDERTPLSSAKSALPKHITFPYSRHSSYSELCDLIDVFKPMDIYPCTVDSVNWNMDSSMSFLFGHIYAGGPAKVFSHDQHMVSRMTPRKKSALPASRPSTSGSQSTRSSVDEPVRERRRRRDSDDESDEERSRKRRSLGSRDDRERRPSDSNRRKSDSRAHHRRFTDDDRSPSTRPTQGVPHSVSVNPTDERRRLHVGNLAYTATENDLKALFKGYLVERSHIPQSGHSSGYGFVDVSTRSEAVRAVRELDRTTFLGRTVSVQIARSAGNDRWSPPEAFTTLDHYSPVRPSAAAQIERAPRSRPIVPYQPRHSNEQDQLARALRGRHSGSRRKERNESSKQYSSDDSLPSHGRLTPEDRRTSADMRQPPIQSVETPDQGNSRARDLHNQRKGPESQPPLTNDVWDTRGRLSPPPTYGTKSKSSRPLNTGSSTSSDLQPPKLETLSPAEKSAKALRHQEAFEAALGVGSRQWSDIGLVSSGGHQVKEEEL